MASLAQKTSISRLAADSIAEGCRALSAGYGVTVMGKAQISPRARPRPLETLTVIVLLTLSTTETSDTLQLFLKDLI